VLIQNSGLGNLINPLTSLNLVYRIPALLFVSGRAYGIPDEPQHEVIGKKMASLLDTLEIPHWDLPSDPQAFQGALDQGIEKMRREKKPVVFFVRRGTFGPYTSQRKGQSSSPYPMKRIEALSIIRESLAEEDLVFITTGKPSRELFAIGDRPGNFYMQGSMGHVASLALGTALVQPHRRVVVIDGDGAFAMHMGAVSTIGHYRPGNLIHLLLDNESYETTGDQDTTSATTDFEGVAKACGYRCLQRVTQAEELRRVLQEFLKREGPALLRIKLNREETRDIPRITTRYQAWEIAESFRQAVQGFQQAPAAPK
jgi:phosphonopyruvate decarboxylase